MKPTSNSMAFVFFMFSGPVFASELCHTAESSAPVGKPRALFTKKKCKSKSKQRERRRMVRVDRPSIEKKEE